MTEEQVQPAETEQPVDGGLKPLVPKTPLGTYAPFEVSDEDMYGPDELGSQRVSAIEKVLQDSCLYETSAGIWEIIQATEARLFDRGYQWLTNNRNGRGWTVVGTEGAGGQGSGAITAQDRGRMWSINIYGARKDKIVSALTVKDPEPEFFPVDPDSAFDQRAADESMKYKHFWKKATNVRKLCNKIGGLFYTDDRVTLITESVASTRKGKLSIEEITRAYGKLEIRVPMSIDEDEPLPWLNREREIDIAVAKEKYPWVTGIAAQSADDNNGSIARTCRITVRNAVGNQSGYTSSNSSDRACTEQTWWIAPALFRDLPDENMRDEFRQLFPDGARVVRIGSKFAYIRNECMDDCAIILYSREGTGQNRRSIGGNNLVTQKVLNYDFSLFNRYMTACVPRKFHDAEKISSEAITQQRNDPAFSIPVARDNNEDISNYTGIETVPTPPAQLMDFIDSMIEGLPDALDGASPSMFGGTDGTDTATGITVQRDQALQVFGTPYNAMTWGIAISCGNAAKWAGRNRSGTVQGMVPGVGRISVEMSALQGDTYCFPEADSGYPETEAEKEQRLKDFIDAGGVPSVVAAIGDPMNYEAANRATKRFGIIIPGTDSVRKQQEEFEQLLKQEPVDNPALIQAKAQVQQLMISDPEQAASPDGQTALKAAETALQQIPPKVSSVMVEDDTSVNHVIEAATCFSKMNSTEGQKLKREKPLIFQNLKLHWQGHTDMAQKFAPPAKPEVKPGVSLAVDKLSGEVQSAVLAAEYGIQVTPEQTQQTQEDVHEISQEKEGVDEMGVPVKQKISYSGKPLM